MDQDIIDMVGSLGPSKKVCVYIVHGVDEYVGELDVDVNAPNPTIIELDGSEPIP